MHLRILKKNLSFLCYFRNVCSGDTKKTVSSVCFVNSDATELSIFQIGIFLIYSGKFKKVFFLSNLTSFCIFLSFLIW